MINVGIAGIGFMGMIHYLAYQRIKGVRVAAICSRDRQKLAGDWRGIQGNFGPPGEVMDLKGIATFEAYDAMLADPKIDLVDLCLPPALHADAAVAALKAGKHVICEKPIGLTTAEADRMVAAASKAGRMLMIAHVLPFFPEFAFARQAVASGKHGRLLGAHFKRIISHPTWIPDFYDPRKVGGPVIDLHIHDAHFIRLLCGMPQAVSSRGWMHSPTSARSTTPASPASEVVEFINTQFDFGPQGPAITAASGVLRQQGRGFTHAFEIYLQRATLLYDFAMIGPNPVTAMPLTVLDNKGQAAQPKLDGGDAVTAFVAELSEAAKAIRTGKPSPLLAGDLARDALLLCHRQTQSVIKGKPVRV
jgi:predicted dehydrogenase